MFSFVREPTSAVRKTRRSMVTGLKRSFTVQHKCAHKKRPLLFNSICTAAYWWKVLSYRYRFLKPHLTIKIIVLYPFSAIKIPYDKKLHKISEILSQRRNQKSPNDKKYPLKLRSAALSHCSKTCPNRLHLYRLHYSMYFVMKNNKMY